ncbi:MAG TPA: pyridoxal phosphate-dependent aminotransferase, partial [Pirellulales bacterium]
FPDVSPLGMSEKDFAVGLLQQEKVAVVPGLAFGDGGKGHVRACFATAYDQIIEACDRVERFVNKAAKK